MNAAGTAGLRWVAVCVAAALAACGGGGGGGGGPQTGAYAISGTISGSVRDGVLVTLSGAASATTTTSAGGVYTFTGLADGTYVVTPSRAGYAFVPPSVTVTVAGASASAQAFAAAATYATADLAGGWEINTLASGPGAPWWFRGRATIAADGAFTGTFDDNAGNSDPASGTFGLSTQDELTLSVNATARGSIDLDRTVMAFTATWQDGSGTTELGVALKAAGSYAAADLAGTWEVNSLATGPGAPWWERARAVIAADGSFTASTTESDGTTGTITGPAGALALAANGVITAGGQSRGALDAGRTVAVVTDTWATGSPGTTEMKLWVKVGTGYALADLAGTWKGYAIASGSGEPWWERLDLTVAADGSWSASALYSDASTDTATGSVTIDSGGVVGIVGRPSFRGVMDAGKTVIVATETWPASPGTTTQMQILVRVR